MSENCIFCKIRDKIISTDIVFENEKMFIIKDINPQAKLHFLMIPKKHFAFLSDMNDHDAADLGQCFKTLAKIAPDLGLKNGFRTIINQGEDGNQTVFHLHIHVLGGEKLLH
ncbi:MAG: HIT domain-containing protein [Firmicutes bacterium]|nr:HIT domain-containing protein [Bacillota bacterium]